jgi:hypothetical protein
MTYQLFDIVMLRQEQGARIYAIVELAPNNPTRPYVGARLDRGPLTGKYLLAEDEILTKIGTLNPEAIKLDPGKVQTAPTLDWHIGQSFARHMAECAITELDRQRWAFLARLQPGDPLVLRRFTRRGEYLERHRFQEVLPNGQRYHFTALNANGTVYKWTLESLHLDSTPK